DARYQGRKIGLIVLGHSVSEEAGLEWLVPVVRQRAPGITVRISLQAVHLAGSKKFWDKKKPRGLRGFFICLFIYLWNWRRMTFSAPPALNQPICCSL